MPSDPVAVRPDAGRVPWRIRILRGLLRRALERLDDPAALADTRRWLTARQLDVAAGARRAAARRASWPTVPSADGHELLRPSIRAPRPPWHAVPLAPVTVPGMLTDEERRYYQWIGRFYAGVGEVVELGCWLGCSTLHALHGLVSTHASPDGGCTSSTRSSGTPT